MYESYSKPTITERLADARDTSDEPYEAIAPRNPPSDRLITQGANLRAILLTRIDTRNPGDLVAQITSDVYDTATASMVLVPRGSRLVGSYATAVSPGNPRIAVAFRRLIFPDGRAIELPDMAAVGNDGVVGVEGDYRGNLLRAIGPSAMVALIGAWADKEIGAAEQTTTNVAGNTTMAPSVIQQVVPQVNQAVLRRYQGAAPYFVAEPGTSLKVLVSADIHIPVAGGNS
jgi:type IV secretion system protein VirB10